MKRLPRGVGSLVFGMKRVRREWISSCLYGFVIIGTLMAMTALYVVLDQCAKVITTTGVS